MSTASRPTWPSTSSRAYCSVGPEPAGLDLPQALEGAAVRMGAVVWAVRSPLVEHGTLPGPALVANREHACLHVPDVADFSVQAGAEVVVDAYPGSAPGEVEAYLYGTVTALVLGQQGRFALHGTTVSVAGSTVAIAGRRGAGKTSAALALRQRGHALLGDDVVILEPGVDGLRAVTTGRPLHVGRDAAAALGLDTSTALSLGPRIEKLAVPQPRRAPSRLKAIVVLVTRPIDEVRTRTATGPAAFRAVHANSYRAGLLRLLYQPELFTWAARVAAGVPVHILARPDNAITLSAVAECIERVAGAEALG